VSGIRVVKGLGVGGPLAAEFRRRSRSIVDRALDIARLDAIFMPTLEFLPMLGLIAVLWLGGRRVISGDLSLGSFVQRLHRDARLAVAGARPARHDVAEGGGRPVVRELTLELHPGDHVAPVGATGAGKSTVAKLLTRQYDPQEGRIELGGVDVRDATLESLHRQIVLLPQEGHLFSGTIADNVHLAHPDATDEGVRSATADR